MTPAPCIHEQSCSAYKIRYTETMELYCTTHMILLIRQYIWVQEWQSAAKQAGLNQSKKQEKMYIRQPAKDGSVSQFDMPGIRANFQRPALQCQLDYAINTHMFTYTPTQERHSTWQRSEPDDTVQKNRAPQTRTLQPVSQAGCHSKTDYLGTARTNWEYLYMEKNNYACGY